ncbi:B-cell receptor-associated protein 29-like [Micropterus dolomieu]|uniref:B-cell receptor-associated protein 29-like n=1 Tax=Micropterus dolomieu TaxID=147949 RepID=UPI001E8EC23C|nr:B-cell receptor-associated protein 29-like [Micropterus dolomieu]XP_045894361.1 B-cell receptor-associated protein 29-like [Micropterus dolomieu]XP_045894362.1 B-cell receptor-associated protein 29-like [Micropterus dolomieu]
MTLQWTAVAFFLYAEIAVNVILCIPFISPQRWRLVFSWRIWNWLSPYWNKCFFTMIMVLIVLFLDAVRDVQKYSGPEPMHDAKVNPNVYDHVHMKLFRAQRNLYISGFSLFLWLIMRRVVTLLNQVAVTSENSAGLQAEMDIAIKAAKQHQDDNLMLRHALLDEERSKSAKNQLVKLEVEKLVEQVKASEEAVRKSHAEVEAMKRQAKGLAQEYDRLLMEHHQLQNLQSAADKKDQ